MADLVQETITEANKQIVDEHGLKLAREPRVELPGDKDALEAALDARGDLAFTVALEVLPKFEVGEFTDIAFERPFAEVEESEVEDGLMRLAQDRRVYVDRRKAARRSVSTGSPSTSSARSTARRSRAVRSENIEVVIGSNAFIPGFEEQLLGVAAGEKRDVEATFPEAYAARKLAGRKAKFDVSVKAVAAPEPLAIDDEFAKSYGADDLAQLKDRIRERIAAEYARASREKVKRKLLDALAARYTFEVPEGWSSRSSLRSGRRSSVSSRLPAAASR